MRELLGEGVLRLGILAYDERPDFYEKNAVTQDRCMEEIADIVKSMPEGRIKLERVAKAAQEGYMGLEEQLKRFGLTRVEYAFLNIFDGMRRLGKDEAEGEGKIMSNPLLLGLARRAFGIGEDES